MQHVYPLFFERKPILNKNSSISNMEHYFCEHKIEYELFKTAILVSSPNLYEQWKNENFEFKKKALVESLYKFYIRASIRPTPYGLFSSIKLFNTGIEENNELRSHFSIDSTWIDAVVTKIEHSSDIVTHLNILINPNLEVKHNRVIIHGISDIVIYKTPMLEFILDILNESGIISCSDLYRIIKENSDDSLRPTSLFVYINSLLKKGVLITELRLALLQTDPISFLIKILSKATNARIYYNSLSNIQKIITVLNNIPLLECRQVIEVLHDKMRKLALSKTYLAALTAHEGNNYLLKSNKIVSEVEEMANFLSDFYFYITSDHSSSSFVHNFIELYGLNVRVPLLICKDLIYKTRINSSNSNKNKLIEIILHTCEDCIDLNSMFEFTKKTNDLTSFALTSELNLNITYDALNQYCLEVAPASGSALAGKMIGRFYPVLSNKEKEMYHSLVNANQVAYENDGVKLTKIDSLYSKPVLFNICNKYSDEYDTLFMSYHDSKYHSLVLSDIYVHVDENRRVIFTNPDGNKLKFVINSALNPKVDSKLMDFLVNHGNNDICPAQTIGLLKALLSSYVYTPRIMYKNIVLIPKTWRFSKKGNIPIEEFLLKYKIPSIIFVTINDNRLLLNLDKKKDFQLLIKQIKEFGSIELQEPNYLIQKSVSDNLNYNISEIIFELYTNKKNNENTKFVKLPTYINSDNRRKDFSDLWIYLKIYINDNKQKDFLIRYLSNIIESINSAYSPEKIFYIRYNDPEQHIRLRIKADSFINKLEIEAYVFKQLKFLLKNEVVENYVMDIYVRELERYGGEDQIENIEDFFSINSLLSLKLLKKNSGKSLDNMKFDFVICAYKILESLGYDDDRIIELYSNVDKDREKSFFHLHRMKLIEGVNNIQQLFDESIYFDVCSQIYIGRKISSSLQSGNKDNIAISLIHMFCNRVFGTNRVIEKDILSDIERLAYAKKGYENAKRKNTKIS